MPGLLRCRITTITLGQSAREIDFRVKSQHLFISKWSCLQHLHALTSLKQTDFLRTTVINSWIPLLWRRKVREIIWNQSAQPCLCVEFHEIPHLSFIFDFGMLQPWVFWAALARQKLDRQAGQRSRWSTFSFLSFTRFFSVPTAAWPLSREPLKMKDPEAFANV